MRLLLSFRGTGWFNLGVPPDFELPVRNLKRLHRYTYWTILLTGPIALFVAALVMVSDMPSSALILGVTVAGLVVSIGLGSVALWLFVERRGEQVWRHLLWAGWAVMAVGIGVGLLEPPVNPGWVVPVAILEAGRLLWGGDGHSVRRTMWSCVAVVVVAAGMMVFDLVSGYALFMAILLVPSVEGGVICQWWYYLVAARLDEARGMAAELAVAEERLRFAAELHDIQGGHLQAIILKTQLARRLGRSDADRAEAELEAVEELARQALKDTRAVVAGYRKVSLSDEIDSAARVLRSAGIRAAVRTDSRPLGTRTEHLLGLLVREATTNILRHSSATEAELAVGVDAERVIAEIVNDGAGEREGPRGNGVAMLAERFGEAGGAVEYRRLDGTFTLTGTLPLGPEEDS